MAKNTNTVKNDEVVTNDTTAPVVEQAAPVTDVKVLMEQLKTKSAVIRHLSSLGLKTGAINKAFETAGVKMRYQHVRNVLITPIKTA
jgi:hypothetical protein